MVGPECRREAVARWLARRFGGSPSPVAARHFFTGAEKYPGGATFQWGHAADLVMVELNGSALSSLDDQERWELLRELLELGLRATRLDLAMDFVDTGLTLCKDAAASCQARELCGARTFTQVEDSGLYGARGRTVYLGQRGDNGSGRLARIYDKGLETGQCAEGRWERFELECTKQVAEKVAQALAYAEPERDCPTTGRRCWRSLLRAYVVGAFEFRRVTGRREKDLRPLVDWWARVVSLVSKLEREVMERTPSDVTRYAQWIGRCVAPAFRRFAMDTGLSYEQVFSTLTGTIEPRDVEAGSVVEQIIRALRGEDVFGVEVHAAECRDIETALIAERHPLPPITKFD